VGITLTVHFEDPFWVGLFEREDAEGYAAARVVFGAEPSDREVHVLVLSRCTRLVFTAPDGLQTRRPARLSHKRAQREAARAMERVGTSTRAQEAMRVALEARKTISAQRRRAEAIADAERRRQLRIAKRKKRHRGH
jgi:hypothetical protein